MKTNLLVGAVALALVGSANAVTPEDKCEATKNKIAGKYAFCRAKAAAKSIKKDEAADYAKCDAKLTTAWAKAEQKAVDKGASCVDSVTAAGLQSFVSSEISTVAAALDASGGLAILPASGQTTSYGAGSDGDLQVGRAANYFDNGDGTISDLRTGLMWEKKGDGLGSGVHANWMSFTWSASGTEFDGTVVTGFLDVLNDVAGGGTACFAGHCDWRLPNSFELQSISDYEAESPGVPEVFHRSATCTGCTDITLTSCSCTESNSSYWTSTSPFANEVVGLFHGSLVFTVAKTSSFVARAVRDGN